MEIKKLKQLYNTHKAICCKCGCSLESSMPLGSVFILDINGNFYCTNCDKEFDDIDDRIYDENLYEN